MNGIIYLIQPAELVNTNRYKIGCSSNNNLDRLKKGYKNGTRFLNIMECIEPFKLEIIIKKEFNNKFKLIAGREYFQGNECEIFEIFNNICLKYNLEKYKENITLEEIDLEDTLNDYNIPIEIPNIIKFVIDYIITKKIYKIKGVDFYDYYKKYTYYYDFELQTNTAFGIYISLVDGIIKKRNQHGIIYILDLKRILNYMYDKNFIDKDLFNDLFNDLTNN